MATSRLQLVCFGFAAMIGFAGGGLQGAFTHKSAHRFPSWARKAPEPTVDYNTLDCPQESEYREVAARLHLEVPSGLNVCADPNHSRLAKLLHYTAGLKIQIPTQWAPELRADLQDPISFLSRNAQKLGFDFSQTESVAYNRAKDVYLGGIFFNEHPMEGLSTLVHEARHSSEFDPGHVECRRGDIPKSSGGCDQELSVEMKKAGAYSYGAAFYAALGLYAENLPKADREYLLSASLATIATRFNVLPESLAQAFDLVVLLDRSGTVSLLHPFVPEPIPLSLSFLHAGEKVERIEFNVRNNGLLLFTSERRAFTWEPDNGFSRLYGGKIPETLPILDAARIRAGFSDYPFYNFLTGDHEIQYYHYSSVKLAYELSPYPTFPAGHPLPELSRLFMGLGARSLFLGKEGHLYLGQRYGSDAPFDARSDLQVAGRSWVHATGGVVYESLYGVTNDGRAQFTKTDLVPAQEDGGYDEEVYSVSESSFQALGGAKARKLLEGLTFRALLDTEGGLSFETYDRQARSGWRRAAHEVVDFAIIRNFQVSDSLHPSVALVELKDKCQLQMVIPDPWLGIGLGLDSLGRFIVGIPGDQPCSVVSERKYVSLKLQPASKRKQRSSTERKSKWRDAEAVQRNVIVLTAPSGQADTFRPYDYK